MGQQREDTSVLRASPACTQDEEMTPIKQDTKKGKLRFYPYNIKCAPAWGPPIPSMCSPLPIGHHAAPVSSPTFHASCLSGRPRCLAEVLEGFLVVRSVNYGLLPQTWEDPAHNADELDGVAVRPSLA